MEVGSESDDDASTMKIDLPRKQQGDEEGEEEEGEEELVGSDDEEMAKYDEKLAEMFKHLKAKKSDKKGSF
jgi:hypothetical protein